MDFLSQQRLFPFLPTKDGKKRKKLFGKLLWLLTSHINYDFTRVFSARVADKLLFLRSKLYKICRRFSAGFVVRDSICIIR